MVGAGGKHLYKVFPAGVGYPPNHYKLSFSSVVPMVKKEYCDCGFLNALVPWVSGSILYH